MTPETKQSDADARDPLAWLLEFGLMIFVVLAPLPFGAVRPPGRDWLELAALVLGAVWVLRAFVRPTRWPPRLALIGLIGLLGLVVIQVVPVGDRLVSWISPRATAIRESTIPPPEALSAEESLLGVEIGSLASPATLSLDPGGTASALKTGVALAALFLVAATVVATRGARRLALALLVSAGFQGLYGLLILASGQAVVWHVPKTQHPFAASGTFISKNHFACFLAMSLPCGMALILQNFKRMGRYAGSSWLAKLFGGHGSRNLLLGLLLLLGSAGLLASQSRAGITLGVGALLVTILCAGRFQRLPVRAIVALLVILVAAVPLLQLGSDRLVERFARTGEDLSTGSRGRVWLDTMGMAAQFPAVGTGFGTFAAVYPLYRSPQIRFFFAHAHSDVVQALSEGGLVGAVFLILLLIPIGRSLVGGLAGRKGTLGVGFAAGLAAILLHALIDFNFHIPANAALAAILAGGLLSMPWKVAS